MSIGCGPCWYHAILGSMSSCSLNYFARSCATCCSLLTVRCRNYRFALRVMFCSFRPRRCASSKARWCLLKSVSSSSSLLPYIYLSTPITVSLLQLASLTVYDFDTFVHIFAARLCYNYANRLRRRYYSYRLWRSSASFFCASRAALRYAGELNKYENVNAGISSSLSRSCNYYYSCNGRCYCFHLILFSRWRAKCYSMVRCKSEEAFSATPP